MKAIETRKVTLESRYGLLPVVSFLAKKYHKNGEWYVNHRSACNALRNNGGDYYPGLSIDRREATVEL